MKAAAVTGFIATRPGAMRLRNSNSKSHPASTPAPIITVARAAAKAVLPVFVRVSIMMIQGKNLLGTLVARPNRFSSLGVRRALIDRRALFPKVGGAAGDLSVEAFAS